MYTEVVTNHPSASQDQGAMAETSLVLAQLQPE